MKIIEFFGLPYSGKTFFSNYLKKNIKKKTFNTKTLLLHYFIKNNQLSLYIFFSYLKNRFFSDETAKNKVEILNNNQNKKKQKKISKILLRKIFFPSFFKFIKEKEKIFFQTKKRYENFHNLIIEILKKEENLQRKKKLKRWLKDEIIAIYIAKQKNITGVLLMSEGFIQRIHSYHLHKLAIDTELLDKYLALYPKSDMIFFVDTEKKIIKQRLEENDNDEKVKFYLKNFENLEQKNLKIMNKVKNISGFEIVKNIKNLNNVNI